MATEHRHFYVKTGLMGGWHNVDSKHPLDATAHNHGDIETRDGKLKSTRTVKTRIDAALEAAMWADVEEAARKADIDALEPGYGKVAVTAKASK